MSLQISSLQHALPLRRSDAPAPPSETLVDKIVDKTILSANYLASGISGGIAGTAAAARSVVGTTARVGGSGVVNWWKAETIGPNLKVIGTLLAAPLLAAGVALAIPASLVAGICHGVGQVDPSHPRDFTVGAATSAGYTRTRESWVSGEKSLRESFQELGNRKLQPGEKPFDIPLLKTAKTLLVGATAVGVGGVTGVVCAVLGTGREVLTGLGHAATDPGLNIGGRATAALGAVVGGIAHGVAFGAVGAVNVLGQGLVQTWKADSMWVGERRTLGRAADLVKASVAPQGTLTREAPPPSHP